MEEMKFKSLQRGDSVLQSQQQAINLMMDSLGLNKPKENPDGK